MKMLLTILFALALLSHDYVDGIVTISQQELIDNQDLARRVREAFLADSFLAKYQVSIKADNGVIILGGYVDTSDTRARLEAKALGVAGVYKVINNIVVLTGY